MTTSLRCHIRTQIEPADPLHCRRSEDRDRIGAQARSWAAFEEAVHAGRTLFEAHALACRVYHEELSAAAVRRVGLGR
jgi:hypothetical protein